MIIKPFARFTWVVLPATGFDFQPQTLKHYRVWLYYMKKHSQNQLANILRRIFLTVCSFILK